MQGVPPGWPEQVLPPQAPDWERSAVAWLYDLCPPDYRAHEVLRRHPVLLARFAAGHVAAGVAAAREGRRLLQAGRQVALVDAALRGERHVPRL